MYNFSDVIVQVTISAAARTMEESIVKLLEWAQTSQSAAVNRAALPHLIVVLNMSNESSVWDPAQTTATVFREQQRALNENTTLAKHKKHLEGLGATINNLEDLLKYSYSSVQFIRLPQRTRPRPLFDPTQALAWTHP